METKRKRAKVIVSVLAMAGLVVFALTAVGGDLEPSGPPGPTMKTLDEVEPRIPISQADIPLTIRKPGSYYLTEDVTATGTAITVAADDVTIDLGGFSLVGPGSGINKGIYMSLRSNVEIHNGTIRDFQEGIYESTSSGQDHRVIDVQVVSNVKSAICLNGKNHLVKGCTVSDNGNSSGFVYCIEAGEGSTVTCNMVYNNGTKADTGYVYGICAGNGSTVTDNTVCNNGTSANDVYGIEAGENCTMTGNTSNNNGNSAGGYVYGIRAGNGSTVTGNTACNNGDSATGNYVYGIYANYGCTVTDNTAYNNGNSATGYYVYGIHASTGSTVTGNTCYDNGNGASGSVYGIRTYAGSTVTGNTAYNNGNGAFGTVYGIRATSGSTVTGNTAYNNGDYGIYTGDYCLIDQNTAYENGTNMHTGTGCQVGLNVAPL